MQQLIKGRACLNTSLANVQWCGKQNSDVITLKSQEFQAFKMSSDFLLYILLNIVKSHINISEN